MGYFFWLAARVLLYASSHRQDSTYHSLCYTSRGALAGTRNSSMGPPHEGSIRWPIAPRANALTTELHLAPGPLKTCSGLEPVPRCEPSTYQPISRWHKATEPLGPVLVPLGTTVYQHTVTLSQRFNYLYLLAVHLGDQVGFLAIFKHSVSCQLK